MGVGGSAAGSSGASAGTVGDSGAGGDAPSDGDAGAAGSDAGGTGGSNAGAGGHPTGAGGSNGGKGGTAGTGGHSAGAGGNSGGKPNAAGGSAGNGNSAGTSGSAGAGGSSLGPVRIGYSEFHDSASGSDDASGHLVDITFEKPAGTQEGDFMLAFFGVDHQLHVIGNDFMLQGWTVIDIEENKGDDGQGTYLLYKFAGADEPASIVFPGVNPYFVGVQGLLSVYRGVNRTAPVNAYDLALVPLGSDGIQRIDTPTPELRTTASNCLLLAGLSPDSAVDAPVVAAWPEGFANEVSVNNPPLPRPYGWANIYLAERTWESPATFPASSIGWDIQESYYKYYGALSFMLALAPEP
jgi:hypothetical protein